MGGIYFGRGCDLGCSGVFDFVCVFKCDFSKEKICGNLMWCGVIC